MWSDTCTRSHHVLFLAFLGILLGVLVAGTPATYIERTTGLLDFPKDPVVSIREIARELLPLALLGLSPSLFLGWASPHERGFRARSLVYLSALLFGLSVACGLVAYGNGIWAVRGGPLEPFVLLEGLARTQWIAFEIGELLLALFVVVNIRPERRRSRLRA